MTFNYNYTSNLQGHATDRVLMEQHHDNTFLLLVFQGIALRGLFIIDKEGVIQHATINNLAIGRSVDETLRTLQVTFLGGFSL